MQDLETPPKPGTAKSHQAPNVTCSKLVFFLLLQIIPINLSLQSILHFSRRVSHSFIRKSHRANYCMYSVFENHPDTSKREAASVGEQEWTGSCGCKTRMGYINLVLGVPFWHAQRAHFRVVLKTKMTKSPQSSSNFPYAATVLLVQLLALQRLFFVVVFCFVFFKKKQKPKPLPELYHSHGMMCFDLSSTVASPVAIRTWCDSHYKKSKWNATFVTEVS